jgi:hypothetical protein
MTMPKPVLRLPCSRLVIFKILIRIYMFWPPSRLCPTPQAKDLEEPFRHEVFKMLKAEGKINDVVIENMMNWRHSGFNVYCGNAIWPHNEEGLKNLARYIIRASFSQERMT